MATSSSSDYSLTARQFIEFALKKLNILAKGESATAEDADDAMIELNLMLKEWQPHGAIWRLAEGSQALTANTASYTLSSTVPYRIIDARYRNSSSQDMPMSELTRQEYYDLPSKTTTGVPTTWFFDGARAYNANVLYIWPVLSSVTTETVKYTYQRRFEDVDDLGNELDITQEHFSTVAFNLAARLADSYGRKGPHIDRTIARAEMLYGKMLDADRPEIIRFVPEASY